MFPLQVFADFSVLLIFLDGWWLCCSFNWDNRKLIGKEHIQRVGLALIHFAIYVIKIPVLKK